ncbi:glycosyl transferase [Penicillium taxi]|uniref:glycosyl transferase n=1 Tax=Penicillium taxi TaxID=168475 RepID=UPI00254595F3|nr:glycosyl transferase [Penicillium taxi]KAJ5908128.1 glycosyl transferase [Penicillium taxi]
MAESIYDIRELPPDQRILAGQTYRNRLYYIAQAAVWTTYLYFTIRLLLLLTAQSQTWQTWAMLFVEAIFAHFSWKEQSLSVAASKVSQGGPRKRLRLHGTKNLPRVDVLIPCCGESEDVILDTVRAACTLDYPVTDFRVLVLDDGSSALLKKAVSELRSQWPHLSYNSRGQQSGQVFAKSGNLNYALATLQQDVVPEFCTILDADSIASPEFLRATLPHLILNPKSALVSTRQNFSNLPPGDPLSQARCHFYTCQNAELDILGRAIDAGSGAVFRRKCIVDVGLYPTFSFSEDWQLSLVLQGMGHHTMQVQEPLQYGLVPTSLTGHIAQRNRWNIGHTQQIIAMLFGKHSFPASLRRGIAWNGVGIIAGELLCLIGFAAVPLLLLSGPVIPSACSGMIMFQLALAVLHVSLTWAYEYLQAAHGGFQSAPFAHLENKWLAGGKFKIFPVNIGTSLDTHIFPGNIFSILRFYLFSSKPRGSFVTGSTANSWNRIAAVSSYMRIYRDLWQNGIFYNLLLLLVTLGAFLYSTAVGIFTNDEIFTTRLLTTLVWPPLLHICYLALANNWVPVAYLLDPPHYPERKTESIISQPDELP